MISNQFNPRIIEFFWPLTNVKVQKVLQQKGERTVYQLSSNEGGFVLKVAETSSTSEFLEKDNIIFDFLLTKGFPYIPKLLKTKDGKNYQEVDGKCLLIMEEIIGSHPEPTPEIYAQLGEITARLHLIEGYPYKSSFTFASVLPDLLENAKKYPFEKEYLHLVKNLPDFDLLSTALIHTDIAPPNTIQKNDGSLVILDWDDVGIGITLFDLGFPLIQQFIWEDKDFFDQESAKTFYSSYFSLRQLPDNEKELIYDAGLFYALMYLPFEKPDQAWKRIQFAIKHKKLLISTLTISSNIS